MEILNKIEAVLFAIGDKMTIQELAKTIKSDEEQTQQALIQLQEQYKQRDGPIQIYQEQESWKMTIRESYLPLVRKIIVRTELPKSVMETLAILAWKAPMKQSELVDIRSNKAYDHIAQIEHMGFITKEAYGRTSLLKLTQKFFDYFELTDAHDIEKRFGKFKKLEHAVAPQKHLENFDKPQPDETQTQEEWDKEHQQLNESYHNQRDQDTQFLDSLDSQITQVGNNTDKTVNEISQLIPKETTQQPSSDQQSTQQENN